MTLKSHCVPRQSVFDRNRRDIVLDLSDFLENKVDGDKFFEENFLTHGMKTLFEQTFARLENRGDQASTFLLTQARGDEKSGEAFLKISPINGDTVHFEIGDAQPTQGSLKVSDAEGGYNNFRTRELQLTFLCIDSTGQHETGPSTT